MLCDQCMATPHARFALPETGLGMIPGVGGTQTLPRLIGVGRALDLVLTGAWLTAGEAHALGLVNARRAARGSCRAARALARRVASLPADLMRGLKRAVDGGADDVAGRRLGSRATACRHPRTRTADRRCTCMTAA